MKRMTLFLWSLLALIAASLQAAPPVTSGLQVWLTAEAGIDTTADGAPVSLWTDQQNGHVFTNANSTLSTYAADSGGGKPAIDFTRSSGFIGDFSATAGTTIGDATIFVVGRFAGYAHAASSSSYFFSIDSSSGGSEHTLGRDEQVGVGPDALYHWRGQPAQNAYYGNHIDEDPSGAFTVYTAIFRGAGSGGGIQAFINGVDGGLMNLSSDPDTAYEADPAQTRIGLWTNGGSGLDGRIRELIIFDRVLSTVEIAQVQHYLADIAGTQILADPAPPISNDLQVWLTARAGSSSYVDGGAVTRWTDQVNGHVFSNANATLPTFIADSGGGLPAIDFTRSSGFIGDFSATAGTTIGDATLFVVGRFEGYSHAASSSSYWLSIDSSTGGSEHTLGRDAGGSGDDAIYHWRGQPNPAAYYGDDIVEASDGSFSYYTATFHGSGSGGGMSARINGVDGNLINTGGGADSAYEADPAQTRIGLWTSNGSGLDGMIREVLIYDRILDADEIAQVEAYLDLQADAGIPAGPLVLDLRREGADVVLSWTGTGTLQSAPAVIGPWSDSVPAANPMTVDTTQPLTAFRLVDGMTTVPPGTVLGTRIASDTFREVEYHLDTGDLYFIGEEGHGFDWFTTGGTDFWWCYMNTSDRGSGLLEYLMLHNPLADDMKAHAVTNGWHRYVAARYSFLTFEPLSNQVTYANLLPPSSPGETTTTEAYTDDYVAVDHDELLILLYRDSGNQNIYLGIGNPSVVNAHGSIPPGDGTPERDNGVRADVALKTNIQLTMDQKLILINTYPSVVPQFGDSSEAYFYVHPPGL